MAVSPSLSGSVEASASPSPSMARPPCPNVEGGQCLGVLDAGMYETVQFVPDLTYTVPAGWANYEDTPGNFLLVPPESDLAGVNADTSEYIGVYDGVAAASADCEEEPQEGFDPTPEGVVAAYRARDGLVLGDPERITIGGLDGLMIDVSLADDFDGTCPFDPQGHPLVPMLIGTGPAGLHHVINATFDMQLYLLVGRHGETIGVEVIDHPGDQSMDQMSGIVEDFVFSSD
jgi:hypothetical protein